MYFVSEKEEIYTYLAAYNELECTYDDVGNEKLHIYILNILNKFAMKLKLENIFEAL